MLLLLLAYIDIDIDIDRYIQGMRRINNALQIDSVRI